MTQLTPLDLTIVTAVYGPQVGNNILGGPTPDDIRVGRTYDDRLAGFVTGVNLSLSRFATTTLNGKRLAFRFGYDHIRHIVVWSFSEQHSVVTLADLQTLPHTKTWDLSLERSA